jgi:hypothetical protein
VSLRCKQPIRAVQVWPFCAGVPDPTTSALQLSGAFARLFWVSQGGCDERSRDSRHSCGRAPSWQYTRRHESRVQARLSRVVRADVHLSAAPH